VEVQPGGKLWLLDNDNKKLTTGDQTYFSAAYGNYSYSFKMMGDEFIMRYSRLDNCGSNKDLMYGSWNHELDGPDIMTVGDPSSRGLYISAPGANIEITDNQFNSNFVALFPESTPGCTITGNDFSNNVFDIYLSDSHGNVINSNTHTGNSGFPIYLLNSEGNSINLNTVTNPSSTEAGLAMLYGGSILNNITDNDFSGGMYGIVTYAECRREQ
jgi:parallel beta-helix repeat protein